MRIAIVVLSLLAVFMSAGNVQGDQWDPGDDNWLGNPSGLSITCSKKTHGPHTLSSSDHRDYFTFRLTKGKTYEFTATGGSGDTIGMLGSNTPVGILIREEDDDSGPGQHFSITYTPFEPVNSETTAEWVLEVMTYSTGGIATYTLEYQEVCGGGGGGGCIAPPSPHSPWPSNGETNVEPDFWTQLDWAPVANHYDIYFGTSSSPPFLETRNISDTNNWLNLVVNTTYYWKVVSINDDGCRTTGPLWSFTTGGSGCCGDGSCDSNESCSSCPSDCGSCRYCGDGVCNSNESCSSCPSDCGSCRYCGDGICRSNESCSSCPSDCGSCRYCGDGICSSNESCFSCPSDCGVSVPGCGMGIVGMLPLFVVGILSAKRRLI